MLCLAFAEHQQDYSLSNALEIVNVDIVHSLAGQDNQFGYPWQELAGLKLFSLCRLLAVLGSLFPDRERSGAFVWVLRR